MKVLSKNLEETNKVAKDFLNKLSPKNDSATIVGLFGDLGSGKTTFTQALAKHLNVSEVVTSPTFVIEKIYLLNDDRKLSEDPLRLTRTNRYEEIPKAFKKLIHIDAYRLDSGKELLSLQFAEIQKDPKNLILIEWPERVADILPVDLVKINFKFISENEREILF
ncbi:MAG: tRNA (adenosine(37)-N6)-threonylcarbamoyltransferase complex ATPase subunit type 1 TsaE [bacterium]